LRPKNLQKLKAPYLKKINVIRERINVRLFTHKQLVLRALRIISILVSLFTLGTIVFYYGFPGNEARASRILNIVSISVSFYLIKYFTQIFYDFHPRHFIKKNIAEGGVLLFLFVLMIFYYTTRVSLLDYLSKSLGFDVEPYILLTVQLYFLIIVGFEVGKASSYLKFIEVQPATLMTISFLVLIFSGAGMLMLPEMTRTGIRFIDALFTAASASCVTGLVVVDTGTFFTFKGQIVILILIQLGGINIISFATFFATFYRSSSVRYQSILKDFLSVGKMSDTRSLLRKIIYFSMSIELAGTLLIFFTWKPSVVFSSGFERFYYSVFHAVSAFNNAGFSLFANNLYQSGVVQSLNVHIIIIILIFLGGIGFMTLEDIYSTVFIRKKLFQFWRTIQIGSKIILKTSIGLVIVGAALFMVAEWNNVLTGQDFYTKVICSLFQSVTTRTAGFNSVDMTALSQPILTFFVFLMFIGASPGSTGGGIKTTTFSIIIRSAIATIKGKKNVEAYHHTFSFSLIDRAYAIALFSIFTIFTSTLLLTFTEPHTPFLKLIFEEVSAFGTVGLSTGITPFLSDFGKLIITVSMFIGRIGPLTLAIFLSRRMISTKYKYPEVNIMVG
jgi:trk system potassium uptake protein